MANPCKTTEASQFDVSFTIKWDFFHTPVMSTSAFPRHGSDGAAAIILECLVPPSMEQFEAEFFPNWVESALPEPDLQWCDLTPDEWREVIRDCRGIPLYQEGYQLDVDALERGDQKPTSSVPLLTATPTLRQRYRTRRLSA